MFYFENTEIASYLLNKDSTKKIFKQYPKFEIEFMELPVKAFSEWYAKAELLRGFEREEYINDMIHIYTTLIETNEVGSPEADLLRLALTPKYKKACADFEKLKADRLPVTNIAEQTMAGLRPVTIESSLRFKPEVIDDIFGLIKDFFSQDQQPAFKILLQTGNNSGSKLVFLTNGNRLADAFKQLIEADFITGCTKKELEKWIFENFEYRYQQQNKQFTLHYLNDIISTTKDKCKKAILNVYPEQGTGKYLIKKA